jgi:hypothetical protein
MAVKLLNYAYKDIDLFYTEEMIEEKELYDKNKLDISCWKTVEHFIEENKAYSSIINNYSKKNSLEKIAILTAHGEDVKDSWHYFDKDNSSSVQRWINRMDGKYKVLILDICNLENHLIKSEKSIVLHPNGPISNLLLMQNMVPIEIFLPGTGYIDSYIIEEELKKLSD